ncbi:GSCOCG00012851001-RA-CDS [Cotesia congregata]|uniref:Uncharacterized protein n=1 Tax=Cotesia congregata TaxID=51543 RepID=A0A8J2HRP3_COTCN|nr:GSCOCG00012851001-RA-CDS [Cotesia congregata]CAG5110241.1 Protein of unknown function [Cotesia congregata]
MYTNPFNRKHSTIRQVLDRFFDPKKPIRRSESVSSSGSASSKSSSSSFGSSSSNSSSSSRRIFQWTKK